MCACIHLPSCVQCILNGTAVHTCVLYLCTFVHRVRTLCMYVVHGCVLTLLVVHTLTLAGSVHELHVPGSP